jgi:phosphoribulokinase
MLGLVGESAAGKTTLVRGVVRILGGAGVTPVCLDDYHRFSRAELLARGLTAADPAANDLELMAGHLAALRAGGRIRKPVYDHRLGTIGGPEVVAPTGLVVAYGMLTLTPPAAAGLFDLTVYLEPDRELRRAWRLARDVSERGYTADEVAEREPGRDRDAGAYIRVQRPLADVVAHFRPNTAGSPELDTALALRAKGADRDPICLALAAAELPGLAVRRLDADEDGRPCDEVVLDGGIAPGPAATAAAIIWEHLPDVARVPLEALGQIRQGPSARHAPALALAQLLIVARLAEARGR